MPPILEPASEHKAALEAFGSVLNERASRALQNDKYYEGDHPLADALAKQAQKADGSYVLLKALSSENWAGTIADSELDRLDNIGYRWNGKTDDAAWEIHQRNELGAAGRLSDLTALVHGRSFAIVWDESGDGKADITFETPDTCAVEYMPGSTVRRRSAIRRWIEDGVWYANLYYPDNIYKFRALNGLKSDAAPTNWERFEEPDEPWPLPNPFGFVPVVEGAINRPPRVRPGKHRRFGAAAGVFERHIPIIDRINYTVFCGLAGLTWAGFQGLALVGDPIVYGEDDKPKQPFDYAPGKIIQIANPDGKVVPIPAGDLDGYLKHAGDYIARLAALSATPAYKMNAGQFVNVSSDSFRVLDDAHIAKVKGHQSELGIYRREIIRMARIIEGTAPDGYRPEVVWANPEMATLAAKADATAKLSGVFPWQVIAEEVWGKSPETIAMWAAMKSSEDLLASALLPPAPAGPQPAPSAPAGASAP